MTGGGEELGVVVRSPSYIFFGCRITGRGLSAPTLTALPVLSSSLGDTFVPACAPMLATTATVTNRMRDEIIDKLDMAGCCLVYKSPNKPNICYEAMRFNAKRQSRQTLKAWSEIWL